MGCFLFVCMVFLFIASYLWCGYLYGCPSCPPDHALLVGQRLPVTAPGACFNSQYECNEAAFIDILGGYGCLLIKHVNRKLNTNGDNKVGVRA